MNRVCSRRRLISLGGQADVTTLGGSVLFMSMLTSYKTSVRIIFSNRCARRSQGESITRQLTLVKRVQKRISRTARFVAWSLRQGVVSAVSCGNPGLVIRIYAVEQVFSAGSTLTSAVTRRRLGVVSQSDWGIY